jgi:hypothetical protein
VPPTVEAALVDHLLDEDILAQKRARFVDVVAM